MFQWPHPRPFIRLRDDISRLPGQLQLGRLAGTSLLLADRSMFFTLSNLTKMSSTKERLLPQWSPPRQAEKRHRPRDWLLLVAVFALGALWLCRPTTTRPFEYRSPGREPDLPLELESHLGLPLKDVPSHLRSFQDCSIKNLQANLSFLDTAHPLPVAEFVHRRDRLAQALAEDKVDAFLVEPGYTFSYYGNVGIDKYHQIVKRSNSV